MKTTSLLLPSLTVLTILASAFLFIYTPSQSNLDFTQFQEFKQAYGVSYSLEENIYRFAVFSKNLREIERHNADERQTYKIGVTKFADMTREEFKNKILMRNLPAISRSQALLTPSQQSSVKIPTEVDWRKSNVLNPVKNQGSCGSCWAFSVTGTLESHLAIASPEKLLRSFSQQQLVDCCGSKGFECLGCSGAWPEWAFNYIGNSGIVQEKEYAYKAVQSACKNTPTAKKFLNSVKPWTMISDIKLIKQSLANDGPISICVDAGNWHLYRSGVFKNCGTTNLNHAVVVIGYEEDGTWIVRNSWGASWGESGHIRLASGNTCGLGEHAVVPNLA